MAPTTSLLVRPVPKADQLPRVDFRRVASVGPRAQSTSNDKINESYGYNSTKYWDSPDSYVKWLQPMEADLSKQVEYDMDDIDQEWLDAVNAERRKEGLDAVSYEFFEVLMDRLEKEWFELSARIPKPASAMAVEDSKCAICDDGECENSNAIVFCDGCNLAVHQDCYGVPYIPEGQWLCRKCTVSPDRPVSCVLCPGEGGAFKQTTTGGWAHLLCAIWVPETGVSNTIYMEPVDGVENIPKSRWKLVCYLCKKRVGAPIQCSNRSCFTAFHVTCARDYGLHLKLKVQTADYKAFCHKHEPREMGALEVPIVETLTEDEGNLSASQGTRKRKRGEELAPPPKPEKKIRNTPKSSRAYSKAFAQGPPIIPFYIHTRLWEYVDRIRLRNKKAFVAMACRYWSLKREARRGAPLLKRLHLEPWTAAAANGQQSEEQKRKKLKLINRLRADLENVRMLCELVKKREKEKLRRAQLLKALVDDHIFPYTAHLRPALQKIIESDKSKVFAKHVDRAVAPDYYEIIKSPMNWTLMSEKLERHEYGSAQALADDVNLVLNNAMIYNKKETPFYKAAQRVQKVAEPVLEELKANDDPASAFQKHATELMKLLDEDSIEAFSDVSSLVPASPPPPAIESPSKPSSRKSPQKEIKSPQKDSKLPLKETEEAPASSSHTRRRTRSGGAIAAPEPEPEADAEEEAEAEQSGEPSAEQIKRDARNAARREARRTEKERRESAAKARAASRKEPSKAKKEETSEDEEASDDEASEMSLHTEDVTPHASFLSFNTGWILPEGSRRRKATDEPAAKVNGTAPKWPSKLSVEVETNADDSDEDEEEEQPPTKKVKTAAGPSTKPRNGVRERLVELFREYAVEEELEEGSLMWAKMEAWPYWPAEAVDPEGARAPKLIKAQRPDDESALLVQFFDPARTWAWIPREKLYLLGESQELDDALCSKQQVRDSRKRAAVRAALRFATSQMEVDE